MEKWLAKLPLEKEKMQKCMDLISKCSFALGLFIELTIVIVEKSEYIIQYEGLWFRITFLLFGLSMVTTKRDVKQWIWFGIFAVIGLVSYKTTGRNEILRWIVFIWACYGKDMKKVLKITFWYTLIGCVVIFLFSVLGIYGKVFLETVYRVEYYGAPTVEEVRYCFGMGHPNAFHCMMLVITWLGIYCYHDKIKWYSYLGIGFLHLLIFYYTDSKTGLLMSIATLAIVVILKYWKIIQEQRWIYIFGILAICFCVFFSVYAAKYSITNPFLFKLDSFLTGRIWGLYDSVNHEGMLQTWSLWGEADNYKFFDMGIVRFFYWFGIIPGIIYFLTQCRLLWCAYRRKDYILLAIVVLITIYSVFEAHFISDYMGRNYILFYFGMYLSDMIGKKDYLLE